MTNLNDEFSEPGEDKNDPKPKAGRASKFVNNDDLDILRESMGEDIVKNYEEFTDLNPQKVSTREIESLEKEIDTIRTKKAEEGEHGFSFRSNCRVCQFAIDDPQIHKLYLMTKYSPTEVKKYIFEKYAQEIRWDQVKNHMDQHFMPVYREVDYKRKEKLTALREAIREREKSTLPNRLMELEEILMQKAEELVVYSSPKNVDQNMAVSKVLKNLSDAVVKIQDFKLKMLGMDQSSEESKQTLNKIFQKKLEMVLSKLSPEDQIKFLEAFNSVNNNPDNEAGS